MTDKKPITGNEPAPIEAAPCTDYAKPKPAPQVTDDEIKVAAFKRFEQSLDVLSIYEGYDPNSTPERDAMNSRYGKGYVDAYFAELGQIAAQNPVRTAPKSNATAPAPVPAVAAFGGVVTNSAVPVHTTAPAWSLIDSLTRSPGYRWPLYQVLKAAHDAGKPCPKAREVLAAWKLNKPPELEVMTDGVKYSDGVGNPKEADLKAIQQAIKGLLKK